MKSLIAHHFLIVDTDVSFACELALAIKQAGGESSIVTTALQAVSCLQSFGADMVLCGKLSFRDTNLLLSWREENMSHSTKVIQLMTQKMDSQPFIGLAYSNISEIIEQIPQLMFGKDDFFKLINQENQPTEIGYQLKLQTDSLSLDPLELTSEGMYFTTENSFAFDDVRGLKVTFLQMGQAKSFDLPGVMEFHSKGGPFFRVHPNYQLQWDHVLEKFQDKQNDISGFLKKAAGY